MNPKDILKTLNITDVGVYEGPGYVIELDNSDAWGRMESKLDIGVSKDILEKLDDESSVEYEGAVSMYQYQDQAKLILTADFDEDVYTLSIEPLEVD